MTREEYQRLAHKFIDTWPQGPKAHVWIDAIRDLDYDRTKQAYIMLRDTARRPPSVADFREAYAATARRATPDAAPRVDVPLPDVALNALIEGIRQGRLELAATRARAGVPEPHPGDPWYRSADRLIARYGHDPYGPDPHGLDVFIGIDDPPSNGDTP